MNDFVLMTDSSCDLPGALARSMELEVVPLTVLVDGVSYTNDLDGKSISSKAFYDLMRQIKPASTSAPSVGAFAAAMEPHLQAGRDLLYLGFSSALSATYSAGEPAARDLREKYPERSILTVDTLCASLGQGMLVYRTWERKRAGASLEECAAFAEEQKHHQCHWFTVGDLSYLYRGGRVSRTTAILGTALQVKPLMHCDDEGRLTKLGTVRGRKQSLLALKDKLKETILEPQGQTIFISHGDCLEEAQFLAERIRAEVPVGEVIINPVGPVIGAHTGPGVMALFHVGTHR